MSQVTVPANHGTKHRYFDTVDPEDPEYQRMLRRPAEVKEDIQQMQARKRVNLIIKSKEFRDELESILSVVEASDETPASLLALRHISELLQLEDAHCPPGTVTGCGLRPCARIIPINDLRGAESNWCGKTERLLRCKFASCFRLIDLNGWATGMSPSASLRLSMEQEHFLVTPKSMLCHEVTAGNLLKVDMQGRVLIPSSTGLPLDTEAFYLHSAMHAARPDIRCILFLKSAYAVAVSCMKEGFLPLTHATTTFGELSYHDYGGSYRDTEEKERLIKDLGPSNKVMFLRNVGVLVCGSSVDEAFYYATNIMHNCETQVRLAPVGWDHVLKISDDAFDRAMTLNSKNDTPVASPASPSLARTTPKERVWKVGELEFEASMRQLDNAGYRTGHIYRQQPPSYVRRGHSDVEIPPVASSIGEFDEQSSPVKNALLLQKKVQREYWLNSPNSYTKVEFDETGTRQPKKITKWVTENGGTSPVQSPVSVKTTDPNLFAPQGIDPKEFKKMQTGIKKHYYEDDKNSGPSSRVLDGTLWEEARALKETQMNGETVVVVGAASKGIIQKQFQHNAVVYGQQYAPNPFNEIDPSEIERYKLDVESKMKIIEDPPSPLPHSDPVPSKSFQSPRVQATEKEPVVSVEAPAVLSPGIPRSESHTMPSSETKADPYFRRSKSEIKKGKRGIGTPSSATLKSVDSGELGEDIDGSFKKQKKKKGLRLPSFSKKKKDDGGARKDTTV